MRFYPASVAAVIGTAIRACTYPDNHGRPVRRDPTHGRIDRDIQWHVAVWQRPRTIGQRVVDENNMQAARTRVQVAKGHGVRPRL